MQNPLSKKQTSLIALALLLLSLVHYYISHYGTESTDDASLETNIVSISPKVSGYIYKIHVEDNQLVQPGDVMLEIDPRDYQITRDKALSALKSAEAKLQATMEGFETTKISAPSSLESARSQVNLAQANWEKAVTDLKRIVKLGELASTKEQLDNAITAEKVALSSLNDAKARLKSAQTAPRTISAAGYSVKDLEAAVESATADLAEADNNLGYTKIIAPFEGRITKRGIAIGSYVQSGQQLLSLVSNNLWVVANFKETQLTNMRVGQKVDIVIDTYPDKLFTGTINSIQTGTGSRFSLFPSENATGNFVKIVQRVPVKILFNEPLDKFLTLGPGMSVIPTVHLND